MLPSKTNKLRQNLTVVHTHRTILHLVAGAPDLEVISSWQSFVRDGLTLLGCTDPATEMDAKNNWSLSIRSLSPPFQVRAVMWVDIGAWFRLSL